MRRRRREPDNRLDWSDPDMPTLTNIIYDHPFLPRKIVLEHVSPDRMSMFAQQSFAAGNYPNWRNDPTYNLAKRKRRR